MKEVLARYAVTTVQDLTDVLEEIMAGRNPNTVYLTINSDSVRLTVVEETLTDGSKVHNIELSEVCK